jgi:hypothetical protein
MAEIMQGRWRQIGKQPLFEKSGAKTFFNSGSLALAAKTPMTEIQKVFLVLFLQKKNCLSGNDALYSAASQTRDFELDRLKYGP